MRRRMASWSESVHCDIRSISFLRDREAKVLRAVWRVRLREEKKDPSVRKRMKKAQQDHFEACVGLISIVLYLWY